MATRSKFRAVRGFSVGGAHFEEGDVVDGMPLEIVLAFGDTFVKADTARTRKQADGEQSPETTEE